MTHSFFRFARCDSSGEVAVVNWQLPPRGTFGDGLMHPS
jgi:hypothetical protein